MTTVKELIERLETFPPDAEVVIMDYDCSDIGFLPRDGDTNVKAKFLEYMELK